MIRRKNSRFDHQLGFRGSARLLKLKRTHEKEPRMSIKFLNWAFQLEGLNPAQKVILLALADNSDDNGYCWPSISTLCTKTGIKQKKTIRSHIDKLIILGFLCKNNRLRDNGSMQSNSYTLNFEANLGGGVKNTLHGVSNNPTTGAETPPLEPPLEPSINKNKQKDLIESNFIEFWEAYKSPHKKQVKHKGDRKTALSAYKKSLKVAKHDEIMKGLQAYLKELRKDEYVGYCGAAAWLNQERWARYESQEQAPRSKADKQDFDDLMKELAMQGKPKGLDDD